jgi:glycosyltransferase involved in cell wall biosynthesis
MQPTETGCITVVEAGAACTPAIITDADCLGSEFNQTTAQVSLPFNEDEYIDLVEEIVKDDKAYRFYQEANHDLAASRDWRIIAEDWLMMFDKALYATV